MADKSLIGWTDSTWPIVAGCEPVSAGCENCWAARLTSGRLRHHPDYAGLAADGKFTGEVRTLPGRLDQPGRWRRGRRIFVSDKADLFHADVPDGFIGEVWDVMGRNQQHTYQILTKRHARMRSWLTRWADQAGDRDHDKDTGMPPMPRGPEAVRAVYTSGQGGLFADMLDSMGEPPEGCAYPLYDWMEGWRFWGRDLFNVWCGVSAEDQKQADIRIPSLLRTPSAVRWLSLEPLLGPIDLRHHLAGHGPEHDFPGGFCVQRAHRGVRHLRWVVVGGESGPGHRPMDLAWIEQIVGQCQDAGVAVFVKQDSGPRSGQQGRIPDRLWIHQFPDGPGSMAHV